MKLKLTTALFAFALQAAGQERIDTDRPDQTESVYTVPLHYVQGELGFGRESLRTRYYQLTYPAFLFKYGITRHVEIRVEGELLSDRLRLFEGLQKESGFEPLEVGAKAALIEEKGLRPKTSLIVHLGLPFTGHHYDREQDIYPSFRFLFQHSLTSTIGLGYNLGAEWDGYTRTPAWTYTISPNINLGKKWYAYVEAFGSVQRGFLPQHQVDGGFAYYIGNDTKIDLSAGAGLGDSPLRHYVSLGFSFRFSTRRKEVPAEHSMGRVAPAVNLALTSLNSKFSR